MTKSLVTWGITLGRTRSIVATTTKTAATTALGISRYHFDRYAAMSANPVELAAALADPGQVFSLRLGYVPAGGSWEKADRHNA